MTQPGRPAFTDHFDAEFFGKTGRALDTFCRVYFRYQIRGLDRLPPPPCLLVGNHSGLGTAELLCMVGAWWRTFGTRRRVTGMMHDFFLSVPGIGHYYRGVGAVPASRDSAVAALAAGHDVLVFPGGDIDSCRPFYRPRLVDFGRRRGYIHVALRGDVPVVPLATIGSHWTQPMAPGGALLARLLGLKRFLRTERVPLPLTGALLLPARITTEVLPAVPVTARTEGMADLGARVERAHELVFHPLQDAVARMEHGRPLMG